MTLPLSRRSLLSALSILALASCGGQSSSDPVSAAPVKRLAAGVNSNVATFAGPRANFIIERSSTGYLIKDTTNRTPQTALDFGVTMARFDDLTVNLALSDRAMLVPEAQLQSLVELYIAFFNRLPDADGMSYWIDQLLAGWTIDQVANTFYAVAISPDYSALTGYSANMTDADFVRVIYKNVLGREQVDQGGLDYWTNELRTGGATRASLVKTILGSAHGFAGDATFGWVAQLLENKLAIGKEVAIAQGISYPSPTLAYSKGKELATAITPTDTSAAYALANKMTGNFGPYSVAGIRADYAAAKVQNTDQAIAFANARRLNAFHVDFLTGADGGTTMRYLRENGRSMLAGGSQITNFTLTVKQALSVPADPTQVRYPADYATAGAKDVQAPDPYCNAAPAQIVFPASYMGATALPAINVAKSQDGYRRMVLLKDVWSAPNPNFTPGCVGDVRQAMRYTLQRLKKLNVDAIAVTPWTNFDVSGTTWRVKSVEENKSSTLNDHDLEWLVGEARALGIGVFFRVQIQGTTDSNGNWLPTPEASVANIMKSYDALEAYMAERGAFLKRIGADGIMLGSWYWAGFGDILSKDQHIDRTTRMIRKLRDNFSGTLIYDFVDDFLSDPYLSVAIDGFQGSLNASVSADEAKNLSVAMLKQKYLNNLNYLAQRLKGKAFYGSIGAPSRPDFFTTGYLEETFCAEGYDINVSYSVKCIQEAKVTDFGFQAVIHEASFEALLGVPSLNLKGINVQYWMDDNVLPSYTFPNLAYSIRGKPAEAITYQWFKK